MSGLSQHTRASHTPYRILSHVLATVFAVCTCVGLLLGLSACGTASSSQQQSASTQHTTQQQAQESQPITIVASLPQWGALASQLGGKYVKVTSCIADQNTSISNFTPSQEQQDAIDKAQLLMMNGAGLDDWMKRSTTAKQSGQSNQSDQSAQSDQSNQSVQIINAARIIGANTGDNPYLWFSSDVRKAVAQELANTLSNVDQHHADFFKKQLETYNTEEQRIADAVQTIATDKQHYTYITTSTIGQYLMSDMGIANVTPDTATQALDSGSAITTEDVGRMQSMLEARQTQLLVRSTQPADAERSTVNLLGGIAGRSDVPILDLSPIMPASYTTLPAWITAIVHHISTDLAMPMQQPDSNTGTTDNTGASANTGQTGNSQSSEGSASHPSNEGQMDPGK